MKTISQTLIKIFIFTAVLVPSFAHAAFSVVQTSNKVENGSFRADYSVYQPPANTTKVYLWIGEYSKVPATWITRTVVLADLPKSAAGYPKLFDADINFTNLGMVPGVVYAYALADKNTGAISSVNLFDRNTAEGLDYKCFTTAGASPCKPVTPNSNQNTNPNSTLDQLSFSINPLPPTVDTANPGKFATVFAITTNVALTADLPVTLKIFSNDGTSLTFVKEGNFPISAGPGVVYPSADNLAPGEYVAVLYSGTTQISSQSAWSIIDPGTPPQTQTTPTTPTPTPGTSGGGQSAYVGGMSISFYPQDQQITETSAVIKVRVLTNIAMPADIEVLSGIDPSQINQSYKPTLEPVTSNQGFVGGEERTFTIPFSGLTKGSTYYFLVKNNATGTQSPVWNFTTKGGAGTMPISPTTIFDSQTSPYSDPGSFAPVGDTISDKGIVPKCGRTQNEAGTIPTEQLRMCTYKDFMQLVANVIQYALIIIGPIIAVVVMYAGAMIIWLNWKGDPSQAIEEEIHKYYGIMVRAAGGVGIVMIAWVLVAMVIKELGVKPEFVLLDLFSGK